MAENKALEGASAPVVEVIQREDGESHESFMLRCALASEQGAIIEWAEDAPSSRTYEVFIEARHHLRHNDEDEKRESTGFKLIYTGQPLAMVADCLRAFAGELDPRGEESVVEAALWEQGRAMSGWRYWQTRGEAAELRVTELEAQIDQREADEVDLLNDVHDGHAEQEAELVRALKRIEILDGRDRSEWPNGWWCVELLQRIAHTALTSATDADAAS